MESMLCRAARRGNREKERICAVWKLTERTGWNVCCSGDTEQAVEEAHQVLPGRGVDDQGQQGDRLGEELGLLEKWPQTQTAGV